MSLFNVHRASRRMHRSMLSRLFRAPISYFDTTPLGRIVSLFSTDVATIDLQLYDVWWRVFDSVITLIVLFVVSAVGIQRASLALFSVRNTQSREFCFHPPCFLFSLSLPFPCNLCLHHSLYSDGLSSVGLPWLLICTPPFVIAYYFFQRSFRATVIQLQRLETVSRSPINSRLTENIGATSIFPFISSPKSPPPHLLFVTFF